jgi:hypothetical protein
MKFQNIFVRAFTCRVAGLGESWAFIGPAVLKFIGQLLDQQT